MRDGVQRERQSTGQEERENLGSFSGPNRDPYVTLYEWITMEGSELHLSCYFLYLQRIY